jgi:CO/xanthine dehydrogenase FAD-binding subunit
MRPQGVAIAIQNMAVWLRREKNRLADIRIALGPAGVKPFRATGAEDSLRGKTLDEESIRAGAAAILREAHFRTSPHRATAEYRQRLAGVLLRQTLQTAWQRAAQG